MTEAPQDSPAIQRPPSTPAPAAAAAAAQQHKQREEMMACVSALEAALLPCLPARELQAVDRSAHSSHQIDVERHARDFMEAAKKLQLYFISLQHKERPTKVEMLQKEISDMEDELKAKSELIKNHEKLIETWRKQLEEQFDKHNAELQKV